MVHDGDNLFVYQKIESLFAVTKIAHVAQVSIAETGYVPFKLIRGRIFCLVSFLYWLDYSANSVDKIPESYLI